MESQLELFDDIVKNFDGLRQELPDVMGAQDTLRNEVYKEGALSHKIKRLMALAVALRAGCPGCILAQTKYAVEDGATKAEVLESVSVAASMGGTTASAWSWMVVKLLKELGKW